MNGLLNNQQRTAVKVTEMGVINTYRKKKKYLKEQSDTPQSVLFFSFYHAGKKHHTSIPQRALSEPGKSERLVPE